MKSTDTISYKPQPGAHLALRTGLLVLWLYVVLLGGTWAVISSFSVRLVSQIVLIALLGVWLIAKARVGLRLPTTPLDKPLLVFLIVAFLATILSIVPRLSGETLLLWTGYALLFYLLVAVATEKADVITAVLIATATIVAIVATTEPVLWYLGLAPGAGYGVSWPSVAPHGELLPPMWLRPRLVAGNPNLLGGYLAPLLPVAVALALTRPSGSGRLMAWLCTGVIALAIAVTASRGSLLASAVGLAAFGLLGTAAQHNGWVKTLCHGWRRKLAGGGFLALLVVGTCWRFLPGVGAGYGSEGVRVELWGYALTMVARRPLFGFGPDTFGLELLAMRSPTASIWDYLPHPHNLYLGIGAELGLIGLVSALWLGLSVGRTWWRATGSVQSERSLLLTGLMAGLVGMAAHGAVEDFRIFPVIVIQGIAFVALLIAQSGVIERDHKWRGWPARWLLAPFAAALLATLFTTYTRWEFDTGSRLANAGRWDQAQDYLSAAAQQDPGIAIYGLQSALAKGWLVAKAPGTDTEQLEAAIQTFEAALGDEPRYALNHANLATLLWLANDRERAISRMLRAVELQPNDMRFRFALAGYYDAEGRHEEAERQYLALLTAEPRVVHSRAWQATLGDNADRSRLITKARETLRLDRSYDGTLRGARLAIEIGDEGEAVAQFRAAVETLPNSPEAWEGLGIALAGAQSRPGAKEALLRAAKLNPRLASPHARLAQLSFDEGSFAKAEREAKRALFSEPSSLAQLVLARLARRQGQTEEALSHYRAALPSETSFVAYGLTAWRRIGPKYDRLPQLLSLSPSEEDAAVYREFTDYLTGEGRVDEAAATYQRWLEYDNWAASEVRVALHSLGR